LHMFTRETLPVVIARAGFGVDDVERRPHLSSANVLAWARAAAGRPVEPPRVDVSAHRTFAERWRRVADELSATVAAAPKPVVAVGASHPQTNFLLFSGVGAH